MIIQPVEDSEEDHPIEDTHAGYGMGVGSDGKRLLTQQEYDALPPDKKKEVPWKERPENIDRKPYIHATGDLVREAEGIDAEYEVLPIQAKGFKSKMKM